MAGAEHGVSRQTLRRGGRLAGVGASLCGAPHPAPATAARCAHQCPVSRGTVPVVRVSARVRPWAGVARWKPAVGSAHPADGSVPVGSSPAAAAPHRPSRVPTRPASSPLVPTTGRTSVPGEGVRRASPGLPGMPCADRAESAEHPPAHVHHMSIRSHTIRRATRRVRSAGKIPAPRGGVQ